MTSPLDLFHSHKEQWIRMALQTSSSIEDSNANERLLDYLFDNLVHILRFDQDQGQAQILLETLKMSLTKWGELPQGVELTFMMRALQLIHCTSRECAHKCLASPIATQIIQQIDKLVLTTMDLCLNEVTEKSLGRGTKDQVQVTNQNLLTVVAHELRTPLTLINAYSQMMAQSCSSLDEEAKLMLEGIIQGADRLEKIISDMLDTAIIHESETFLEIEPIKVNGLLLQTCSDLTSAIEMRGQSLIIKSFPSGTVSILGDQRRLKQALWNVLSNAVKYTPDGGEILVESVVRNGFVEIHIQDQGIGIPEQEQNNIFGEYQILGDPRHHSSGKIKFNGGGIGLGLALARGIVEAHGGKIWVESPITPNSPFPGTTFHLILPATKQANLPL